jgi:hypothetical protein
VERDLAVTPDQKRLRSKGKGEGPIVLTKSVHIDATYAGLAVIHAAGETVYGPGREFPEDLPPPKI